MKNFNSQEAFINKVKDKVVTKRSSLVGEKFNIISMMGEVKYEVEVKKLIGIGGSSMVYEVTVDDTYPPIKNMIMKEFYPNYNEEVIKAERNPISPLEIYFDPVDFEAEERIRRDRDKFMDAYNKHIRIMDMDRYLEGKIVRPYRLEIDNAYLYALYEVDTATSVDKYYNLDLSRIVDILKQTADILIHLHNNEIIYMDLKPENILYDYNNARVKLFDFDAAIDLKELDFINEFYMPNEKAFIPPELRYITDISNRKELFISEEIDLYMLGVTFFYLLTRRYPVDLENEDMNFLERNVREVLNHKSNKILINKRATDGIVELLKETLCMHRFISVTEFRDKLIEIENNLRFRNDDEFSNIISATYFLDLNRLYNYIVEDEDGKHIDVAIVGNNALARTFFSFIFAIADIQDVALNITFYDKNPKKFYSQLTTENPLLAETTKISVNNRVVANNINPDITDCAYANITFKSFKDRIDQSYITILDETGYDYPNMADQVYNSLRDEPRDRIILNYSRNNHKVDIREEGPISFYNLDLSSTPTFRNRNYNDQLLDEAFEFYRLNVLSYHGERIDYDSIWNGFIRKDFYALKASLRAVLSIKYRIFSVGIEETDDVAGRFYNEIIKPSGKNEVITMRDILSDYEHHSWNRFMIAQGYRVPTRDELYSYAFNDQKGYVDYQRKFHPFITSTDIEIVRKGGMDKLAEVTAEIDELIAIKTVHKEEQVKSRLLNIANNTLWDDNQYLKDLRPLWEDLTKLADKIIDNEYFANNSLNVLTYQIDKILDEAHPDLMMLATDYYQILDDLDLIVQRNKDVGFRESEYLTIDSIPLISSDRIKTIYKPFIEDDENLWANIIATIKFYPENLIFLSDDPIDENRIYRISNFLINKRLQSSLKIDVITYEQMQHYSRENAVVDFTLNSHSDAMRPEFAGLEYVEYRGFNVWSGNYKALEYYLSKRSLTVEETFFLNNGIIHDKGSITNASKLYHHYDHLWDTYLKYNSDDWDNLVRAINYNSNYYKLSLDSYEKKKDHSLIKVGDFRFRKHDVQKYRYLKELLEDLCEENLIIDYEFPANPGRLRLHTYNDDMSRDIGEFISKNMWEYNMGFDLQITQQAEKNYKNSYAIRSDKLIFSYEYKTDHPTEFADSISTLMVDVDADKPEDYTRVFSRVDDMPYVQVKENSVLVNYELGEVAFREFFSNRGNILRSYTYFELIKSRNLFDEIKLNVNLRWKAYDDYSKDSLPIENILDIVCTKGFSTFIISTIKDNIKNEDLYEINNHAKQFGIDARPILIASNSNDDTTQIKKIAAAAKVYFIDREMIVNHGLIKYIENIVSGKKDWQKIS